LRLAFSFDDGKEVLALLCLGSRFAPVLLLHQCHRLHLHSRRRDDAGQIGGPRDAQCPADSARTAVPVGVRTPALAL